MLSAFEITDRQLPPWPPGPLVLVSLVSRCSDDSQSTSTVSESPTLATRSTNIEVGEPNLAHDGISSSCLSGHLSFCLIRIFLACSAMSKAKYCSCYSAGFIWTLNPYVPAQVDANLQYPRLSCEVEADRSLCMLFIISRSRIQDSRHTAMSAWLTPLPPRTASAST